MRQQPRAFLPAHLAPSCSSCTLRKTDHDAALSVLLLLSLFSCFPPASRVEEEQVKNIKTYYKPGEAAAVPYLPFLVGVVLAMLAATAVVVQQTS